MRRAVADYANLRPKHDDVIVTSSVSGTEWKIGDEVEADFIMKTFDAAGGAAGTEEWDSTYTISS